MRQEIFNFVELSSDGDFVAISFSIPLFIIHQPNKFSILLCIMHSRSSILRCARTTEFCALSRRDCIILF